MLSDISPWSQTITSTLAIKLKGFYIFTNNFPEKEGFLKSFIVLILRYRKIKKD